MNIEIVGIKRLFIRLPAYIAERNSRHILQAKGFTVQGSVLQTQGGKTMDNNENIMAYNLAMSMALSMLNKSIISVDEFNKIEQKFCKKYCIDFSSVFRYFAG